MDAEKVDPTGRRMEHFSRVVGAGGFIGVNVWPWITPYPADLWTALAAGQVTPAMLQANDMAIAKASRSPILFVATGVEPPRRHREAFRRALGCYLDLTREALCLGTSPDGWPLHPLARGKFAIPNTRKPVPWRHQTWSGLA
jgi:hypothetical protein